MIKFKSRDLFLLICLLVFTKALLLLMAHIYSSQTFGGGNDSNYYDAYALGYIDVAANVWPIILRWLNNIGLYSREYISYILTFLAVFIIPWQVAKISIIRNSPIPNKIFWFVFFIVSCYPTLFYISLDIYRDDFMLFIALIGFFLFRALSSEKSYLLKGWLLCFGLGLAYVLYLFRPYLGAGFLVALLFSPFYSFKRYPFSLSILLLIACVSGLFYAGLLDPILKYRTMFSDSTLVGGSNLGISFTPAWFLPYFVLSVIYQIGGFFFGNIPSTFAFFTESIIFNIALIYLIKNRKYSNKFVDYLVVFFVAYGVIWVLGNGNQGTAVRLRMFNYLAVYIACFIVYQNKLTTMTKIFQQKSSNSISNFV